MAASADFLTDLGIVLMVAALALLLVRTFRQPLVLGYLVAGVVVGPYGFGGLQLVSVENVEILAQLGIIFIMVSLGLEFNPRKLRAIGAVAVGAAIIQMLTAFAAGVWIADHMGLDRIAGLFIASALAISSTLVAVKVLEAANELQTPHGRLAVGVLLVQDVVSVGFLAVAGGINVTGGLKIDAAASVIGGLGVFTLAALVLGALLFPRFIHYAARASNELLLIVLLGLTFGVSLLALHFGFSIALGAFIVGAIIAETDIVETADRMVEPLKDMFTAVFFVSIGMLIEPRVIVDQWDLVLLLSGVVIASRMFIIPLPSFLFGAGGVTGMRAGAALSQVGEFSFIIISTGIALAILDASHLALFTGVAGVTTLLTPYAMRATGPVFAGLQRIAPPPIRTFGRLYSGWVDRLKDAEETDVHRGREIVLLRRIMLNVVALIVLGGIMFLATNALTERTFELAGRVFVVNWFVWPLLAIVGLPFLLTIWRGLRELAVEIVLELVPDRLARDAHTWPVRVVRTSMGMVAAIVVFMVALVLLPEFTEGALPVLIVASGIAVVAAAIFWRQVRDLHAHVERTITDLFGTTPAVDVDRDEILRVIGVHYSISLATETVKVAESSRVAFQSIQRAQIRNRSGATIVCIDRPGGRIVNPDPGVVLRPGDQLLLMGETHHLEKARAWLAPQPEAVAIREVAATEEPVKVRELTLGEASPVAGRSIAELQLRTHTGASLVAAIRGSDHIQNPAPGFQFERGDRLFLFGTTAQLDRAEAFLATGDPHAEGPLDRFRRDVGPIVGIDLPSSKRGDDVSSGA